jgi:hypothetical protein
VILRSQWKAEEPKTVPPIEFMDLPAENFVLYFIGGDPESRCTTLVSKTIFKIRIIFKPNWLQEECSQSLLKIQQLSFNYYFNDIVFNFIISEIGIIEGRGWDISRENLYKTIFVGSFMELDTKGNQTWNKLIADGKVLGKLASRLKIEYKEYEGFFPS